MLLLVVVVILVVLNATNATFLTEINIDGYEAVKAAEFAVHELKKLSDSGIYATLSLNKIISANFQRGVYHNNTILEIELSSPHFKSGKTIETYSMIVMKHLEDGISSFAIDEFPVMKDDAIEEFYIQKVESKRKKREESFRRLELEAYMSRQKMESNDYACLDKEIHESRQKDREQSVGELLSIIDSEEKREVRRKNSQDRVNSAAIPLSLLQVT